MMMMTGAFKSGATSPAALAGAVACFASESLTHCLSHEP